MTTPATTPVTSRREPVNRPARSADAARPTAGAELTAGAPGPETPAAAPPATAGPAGIRGVLPELTAAHEVLAVVAHPDDESFGLGAVLSSCVDAGLTVRLLCLTAGEASTISAAEDLGVRRARELAEAAERLGLAEAHLEGLPDGGLASLPDGWLVDLVSRRLQSADAVLAFEPAGVTGHPDHVAASSAARAAAERAGLATIEWGLPPAVANELRARFAAPFVGRGGPGDHPIEVVVDRRRQRAAIDCHTSQEPANPLLRHRLELSTDREFLWVHPAPYPARLSRFVSSVGPLARADTGAAGRRELLAQLVAFAAGTSWPAEALADAPDAGYGVHCLHDDPAGWTLASVVTRSGSATPPHDHESWGAAATVVGCERNIRLAGSCPDHLHVIDEQLAPRGGGYLFRARDIHQACDASGGLTVSVHLLISGHHGPQRCREPQRGAGPEPAISRYGPITG